MKKLNKLTLSPFFYLFTVLLIGFLAYRANLFHLLRNQGNLSFEALYQDGHTAAELFVFSNSTGELGWLEGAKIKSIKAITAHLTPFVKEIIFDQYSGKTYQQIAGTSSLELLHLSIINDWNNRPRTPVYSCIDTSGTDTLAKNYNFVVMVQPSLDSGQIGSNFIVYLLCDSNVSLYRNYTSDITVGDFFINDDVLYALEKGGDRLVVFFNFLAHPDKANLQPTVSLSIAGATNLHGMTYSPEDELMILTDLGQENDPQDGAFQVIPDFPAQLSASLHNGYFKQGTFNTSLNLGQQIHVAGDDTMLGDPMAVVYDQKTQRIFIAEAANGGGRLLCFELPSASGSFAPVAKYTFPAASAVFLRQHNKQLSTS